MLKYYNKFNNNDKNIVAIIMSVFIVNMKIINSTNIKSLIYVDIAHNR